MSHHTYDTWLFNTAGGLDHRVTFLPIQLALIAFFFNMILIFCVLHVHVQLPVTQELCPRSQSVGHMREKMNKQ